MKKIQDVEIAVIGMGVVGIATAYYLCKKYHRQSVLLIDPRDPMTYTTAQSGDNYRNWWPSQLMTQFSNDSISLMQQLAHESSNYLQIKQRGYALATRRKNIGDLVAVLESNFNTSNELIRMHTSASGSAYPDPWSEDWASSIDGVDVIANKALIRETFPSFASDVENVIHIRRAGDFSSQQMGQYMLQQIKPVGCTRLKGQLKSVEKNQSYRLEVETDDGTVYLNAEKLVNAAGPYVGEVAAMLGCDLPVENIFHQKLAFEDQLGAVPRNMPFSIDIDETTLSWSSEERSMLEEDPNLNWLSQPIVGGIHCRPEGSGRWLKLGWAYNRTPSLPNNQQQLIEDPSFNPNFPEIVLRGASKLNPSLMPYIDTLPKKHVHDGGYYTMTKENWPLVGPLDGSGAYVVGALSGFGCMAACAAGSLCADWVCDGEKPDYASALSPQRYADADLMAELGRSTDVGLL